MFYSAAFCRGEPPPSWDCILRLTVTQMSSAPHSPCVKHKRRASMTSASVATMLTNVALVRLRQNCCTCILSIKLIPTLPSISSTYSGINLDGLAVHSLNSCSPGIFLASVLYVVNCSGVADHHPDAMQRVLPVLHSGYDSGPDLLQPRHCASLEALVIPL